MFALTTPLQATHWFEAHRGAVGSVQSVSARHSTHEPGVPVQKRAVPVPEQGAVVPQRHPRPLQVFASVGLQATPQPVHSLALVPTHVGTPPRSQQSSSAAQPAESVGSHAPHCPSSVPVWMHAPAPPCFAAQRWLAVDRTVLVSQATQTLPTQSGFFALPLQSLSAVHSTHLPVLASHTGVAVRFLQ